MLLGVRKCPENESLLLRAVAMGISVGGVVCWGLAVAAAAQAAANANKECQSNTQKASARYRN
jgi:hypothetical protein